MSGAAPATVLPVLLALLLLPLDPNPNRSTGAGRVQLSATLLFAGVVLVAALTTVILGVTTDDLAPLPTAVVQFQLLPSVLSGVLALIVLWTGTNLVLVWEGQIPEMTWSRRVRPVLAIGLMLVAFLAVVYPLGVHLLTDEVGGAIVDVILVWTDPSLTSALAVLFATAVLVRPLDAPRTIPGPLLLPPVVLAVWVVLVNIATLYRLAAGATDHVPAEYLSRAAAPAAVVMGLGAVAVAARAETARRPL